MEQVRNSPKIVNTKACLKVLEMALQHIKANRAVILHKPTRRQPQPTAVQVSRMLWITRTVRLFPVLGTYGHIHTRHYSTKTLSACASLSS